jgi:hypothetical protein
MMATAFGSLASAARFNYTAWVVKSPAASSKLGPLPHRLQHGPVELAPETVKDVTGAPAQPYRGVDVVDNLLRRGCITREMAIAADTFRTAFRVAHLDALRAADMARVPGGMCRGYDAPVWARKRVTETLTALGGVGRAPGSAAWDIIGLEWSVSRWATQELGHDRHVATGVLIATLCLLDALYSGRRSAA